jgi:hypothetical protein
MVTTSSKSMVFGFIIAIVAVAVIVALVSFYFYQTSTRQSANSDIVNTLNSLTVGSTAQMSQTSLFKSLKADNSVASQQKALDLLNK